MTPDTKVRLTKLARSLIEEAKRSKVSINEARKGFNFEANTFYGDGDGDGDDYDDDDDEGDRTSFLKDRKAIFDAALNSSEPSGAVT